jgi:AcrR family transcriptional regulator
MAAKIVDKEAKREAIFKAALRVFSQKGVANTTIKEIADAAGIGKGTIYEYFNSKDDIIKASFEHIMMQATKNIKEQVEGIDDPIKQIKGFFRGELEFFKSLSEEEYFVLLSYELHLHLDNPDKYYKHDLMTEFMNVPYYMETIEFLMSVLKRGKDRRIFRDDMDPESFAVTLMVCISTVEWHWAFFKEHFDFEKTINSMVDALLYGICTHPPGG